MVSSNSVPELARRAARLRPAERTAALRAAAWLAAATLAVRMLPYRLVRRVIHRIPARPSPAMPETVADHGLAIARAARVIPGATCLPQAVAAACLLRRDGRGSVLTIGVALGEDRALRAHAWLDAAGEPIVGAQGRRGLHVILSDAIAGRP